MMRRQPVPSFGSCLSRREYWFDQRGVERSLGNRDADGESGGRRVPGYLHAGASGIQLAEALHKLKNPPAVVFVTAYSDHAVEAFDVDATDYLMKPVEEARLDQAINKALARVKPTSDSSKSSIERIPVEKGGRKVLIPVDQIRYIMAKDDYSCIFTEDDRYLSTTSLAQFESKLGDFGFFRVHRRYIVNLANVEDVETVPSGAIQLGVSGVDDRIPVSRRRVVPLKKALNL